MLWDSKGGWVLCLNREYNHSLKLLDPELLKTKTLNPKAQKRPKPPETGRQRDYLRRLGEADLLAVLLGRRIFYGRFRVSGFKSFLGFGI